MSDTPENQNTVKVNAPTDKEYVEIINSEVETDSKYIDGDGERTKIVYYCRDCKDQVKPKRIPNKLSFKCTNCERNVSFGTEESIHNYYKVKQKQS